MRQMRAQGSAPGQYCKEIQSLVIVLPGTDPSSLTRLSPRIKNPASEVYRPLHPDQKGMKKRDVMVRHSNTC